MLCSQVISLSESRTHYPPCYWVHMQPAYLFDFTLLNKEYEYSMPMSASRYNDMALFSNKHAHLSFASNLLIYHRLPVEIVRLVLEYAASQSRSTSYILIQVSKTVEEWILPFLYQTVILESTSRLLSFSRAISTLKYRPGNYTKALYIPHSQYPMIRPSFLTHFPALEHLAISSSLLNYPSMNAYDLYPSPVSITISGSLKRVTFDHPVFQHCTHLYLPDDIPSASSFTTDLFPRLTHLACAYRHGRSSTTAFTCLPLLLSQNPNPPGEFVFQNESGFPSPASAPYHVELEVLIVELYMSNGSPDATGFVLERLGLGVPAHQRRLSADPRLFLRPGELFTTSRWENDIVNKVMWITVEKHIESRR